MTKVYLVRHGESEWNAARRLQGQADPPLSPRGEAQVAALKDMLSRLVVDRCVASDLRRARRTAELLGVDAEPVPAWREIDVGAWSGREIEELREQTPEAYLGWRAGTYAPPGGEPWDCFSQRASAAMRDAADGVDTVLAITHGGVIRALVADMLGVGPQMLAPVQPASMTVIELGTRPRLRTYNLRPNWTGDDAPD